MSSAAIRNLDEHGGTMETRYQIVMSTGITLEVTLPISIDVLLQDIESSVFNTFLSDNRKVSVRGSDVVLVRELDIWRNKQ